jgi:hypothetical protein
LPESINKTGFSVGVFYLTRLLLTVFDLDQYTQLESMSKNTTLKAAGTVADPADCATTGNKGSSHTNIPIHMPLQ